MIDLLFGMIPYIFIGMIVCIIGLTIFAIVVWRGIARTMGDVDRLGKRFENHTHRITTRLPGKFPHKHTTEGLIDRHTTAKDVEKDMEDKS